MRLLLFFCTIIFTACSGQQTNVDQTPIDTVKLFDPRPDKIAVNFMPFDIYKNCIAIKQGFFVTAIDQIQHRWDTESELANYINAHSGEIKNKMYVLYDSTIKFKQIVTVLDLLKKNKVDNYRVVDMNSFFNVPPPVIVQPPTAVSTTMDENDSTNFIITIFEKGIQVKHLNTTNNFANASGLDRFITKHKPEIDSTKIFVAAATTTAYRSFKPVKEVLKKHKYFIFKIVADKQNY